MNLQKTIWTCWFQGREQAPRLVRRCISSWEESNPGWTVRCVDRESATRLAALDRIVNSQRSVTAASASDILRISLLHEFGGVWVDATCLCNRPLDEWLPQVIESEGFFAFDKPSQTRPVASWFLAASPGATILDTWYRETLNFWQDRRSTDNYFWFHHLFRDLLTRDADFAQSWDRVPKISADGPHSLQHEDRMYRPLAEAAARVDWSAPLFKLTHRLKNDMHPESFLSNLVRGSPGPRPVQEQRSPAPRVPHFAGLSVTTDNLGDHLQIIAADRLLGRLGLEPEFRVDRDCGLSDPPPQAASDERVGLILNGWFKRGNAGWPPSEAYSAIPIGLHLRPAKSLALLSPESIAFFKRAGPIGCRDTYTRDLLASYGIEVFESNCLSILFERRACRPQTQTEIFVVSRDERLLEELPRHLQRATYITHYTGTGDFAENMDRAQALLEQYRERAALIVTTFLHCALPAIAMGIPVVVFYPHNSAEGHRSDVERFSSLSKLVPVYRLDSPEEVNWSPGPVDLGAHKLDLLDRFFALAARWNVVERRASLEFAPPART